MIYDTVGWRNRYSTEEPGCVPGSLGYASTTYFDNCTGSLVVAAMPVSTAWPVTVLVIAMTVVGLARLVANWWTRYHHAWRADWRVINRRRVIWSRLSDHHSRQRRKRETDSDAYVDPGLREGHATYENRCN